MYYYIIMNLKQEIQQDFVAAMKAKNEIAKSALSGIKAKITEAEKANGNRELNEDEVIKVIIKAIKQREESAKIYTDGGRLDLAERETAELAILSKYLPTQMTEAEIEIAVRQIISEIESTAPNKNALIGKATGAFNKQYQGRADIKLVSLIINRIVG